MATNVWTGAVSTDFADADNWTEAHAPGASYLAEPLLYDHRAQRNCTTNIGRAADGIYTGGLSITEGFVYNLGGLGNSLIIKMNAVVRAYGAGEFWFDGNVQTVPEFVAAPVKMNGNGCQIDGTLTDLTCLRGKVELDAGAAIASNGRVRIMQDPDLGGQPLVIVPAGATINSGVTLTMRAGEVQTEPNWPTLVQTGGLLKLDKGTLTTAYLDGGELRPKESVITTLYQGGGVLDGKTYAGWTITTAYIEAGVADFQNGGGVEPATLKIYPMATVRRAVGVS